jgi:hypothetical protein
MLKEASDPINEIRSKIKSERASLSHLNGQISDHYLKQQLKTASNLLDDVEGLFLPSKIVEESRTADQWANWLECANSPLKHARHLREHVEVIVRKFGPDARSFSS